MNEDRLQQLEQENQSLRDELARLRDSGGTPQATGSGGEPNRGAECEHQHHLLDELVSHATIGMAVVHGREARFELANPAYLGLVGANEQDLVGRKMAQCLPPELTAGEKWLIDSVFDSDQTMSVREYESQIGGRETYWDLDHVPLHDAAGRVEKVLIIARNVTDEVRQRRHIALSADMERSTNTLSTLIDILPAGVLVADAAGHIIMENDHSRKLMAGPATGDAYHSGGRYELLRLNGEPFPADELPLPRALQEGVASEDTEILLRFEEGRETIVSAAGSPVRNEDGELVGAVSVMQDITARKAAEREREGRLVRLTSLIEESYAIVGERTMQGLLQAAVRSARELTDCRQAFSGHIVGNHVEIGMVSCSADSAACPENVAVEIQHGGAYQEIIESKHVLRVTREEMARRPRSWGMPDLDGQPNGLLGAPLIGASGLVSGIIMLSDKRDGEFTEEDEASLAQLATLTSLGLQHIEARREAERRAREMEAVFAALTDVVIVYGPDGQPAKANPMARQRYGLEPVGMTRLDIARLIPPRRPDGSLVQTADLPSTRALRGETVSNEVFAISAVDGTPMVISVSAAPLKVDGILSGAVMVWHDITEREQLLAKVQAEQQLLAAVFAAQTDVVLVYDEAGKIVRTNEAAQRLYGINPTDFERPALARALMARHPDGTPLTPEELPSTKALRGETVHDETILITVGGRAVTVSNSAAPLLSEGKVTGAVAVWRDITERNELMARIDRERRLLDAVLRQIPEAIVIAEAPSGLTILANERLIEYLGEPLHAEAVADYGKYRAIHLDGRKLAPEDWPLARTVLRGETVENELMTIVHRDGTRVVLSVSSSPVHDGEGHLVAGVETLYEVDPTTFTPRY